MNLDRLLTQILVLLNALLDLFKRGLVAKQEDSNQAEVDLAKADPAAAFNAHFGGGVVQHRSVSGEAEASKTDDPGLDA